MHLSVLNLFLFRLFNDLHFLEVILFLIRILSNGHFLFDRDFELGQLFHLLGLSSSLFILVLLWLVHRCLVLVNFDTFVRSFLLLSLMLLSFSFFFHFNVDLVIVLSDFLVLFDSRFVLFLIPIGCGHFLICCLVLLLVHWLTAKLNFAVSSGILLY